MNKGGNGLSLKKTFVSLKPIDIFALVNLILFFAMSYGIYFDRFIKYRGSAYIWEFFVYAFVIFALIIIGWRATRSFVNVSGWLLLMAQAGIIIHFVGGLAFWGNKRIYDVVIMGVRYDKYVHFFNAFVAGLFVRRISLEQILKRWWISDLASILIVLGLGAIVEIVEYMVMLTVAVNGVGNYDNNMQDLIANLAGVTLCIVAMRIVAKMLPAV